MEEIFYVSYVDLHLHPENMRRRYEDIDALSASIVEQGVIEPLVVVREGDRLIVVDGNRRLKALQLLEGAAPTVPCRLTSMSRREQFLFMATTFLQRRDIDPISEALHYRRLVEEGESQQGLARLLGINLARVSHRLKLLELDKPIQQLIAGGELYRDYRLASALLEIDDVAQRIELARYLAAKKITLKGCIGACKRLKERAEERQAENETRQTIEARKMASPSNGSGPAVALAMSDVDKPGADTDKPGVNAVLSLADIRGQAREICEKCDEFARLHAAEPAWSVIVHAGDATCEICGLHTLRGACRSCPLPGFLRRVALYSKERATRE